MSLDDAAKTVLDDCGELTREQLVFALRILIVGGIVTPFKMKQTIAIADSTVID